MRRWLSILVSVAALGAAMAAPALANASSAGASPTRGVAPGWLPLYPQAFARAKAAADRWAAARVSQGRGSTTTPLTAVGPAWQGEYDSGVTPGDPTGAIGPNSYIEMVNLNYGVYNRSGALRFDGSLATLTNDYYISDPQVFWDPYSQRFFFSLVDYIADTIHWGFTVNSDPQSSQDFCTYTADFGYGSDLPDYPRLGDTQSYLLIGANIFANFSIYLGSDLDWISKPPPGQLTACPSPTSFSLGRISALHNADGSLASTPLPPRQVDPSTTGWVLGSADVSNGCKSFISVFQASELQTGGVQLSAAAAAPVPSYCMPASAPQAGNSRKLDTLDGRLEQAVAGVDPSLPVPAVTVWTAHAVLGGAGSEERWYEINPASGRVVQSGKASDSSLFVFNGAISPDRAVTPISSAFGSDMVMGFNTSSSTTDSAIQMISQLGPTQAGNFSSALASSFTSLFRSPGFDADKSCKKAGSVCRWGDYSGASPDPSAPLGGTEGEVWLSNQWNVASQSNYSPDWRTLNWAAVP